MYLYLCWAHPMPAGTQKNLNVCWPTPSHGSEDTKWIPPCVDGTHPMSMGTQNTCQYSRTNRLPCRRGHKICLTLCWKKHIPRQWRQEMHLSMCWTKVIPFKRGHKMHISSYWPYTYHLSEYINSISTLVDQTHFMPARKQNISLIVLQRRHKIYLNLCWPNPLHASEDTKCIPTCVDQTTSMPERTQNESQHVLTKPLPCQQAYKIYLNMCWPNPLPHSSEDTKCISAWDV